MTDLHLLFDQYGLAIVFAIGFAEFVGFPVAGVPFMIAAGSLAATQGFSFLAVVVLGAAGAWIGDALWFKNAHDNPTRVINVACGLTSNPKVCVTHVQRKVLLSGQAYLVFSKLIPGIGNLSASAAGLGSVAGSKFLPVNAAATLLWSVVLLGIGWSFSAQIDPLLGRLTAHSQITLSVVLGLVLAATVWRVYKVRLHTGLHVREGKGR